MGKKTLRKIFGAAFLLFALYIAVIGVINYGRQLEQQNWPVTQATVTDAEQRYESSGGRNRRSTVYDIHYVYTVDGQTYTGRIVGTSRKRGIDTKIDIKYDPQAPEQSTYLLEPQFWGTLMFNLAGAAVFGLVGAHSLGLLKRKVRRTKPKKIAGRKISFPVVVSAILIAVSLITGVVMLSAGIRSVTTPNTDQYHTTSGYLTDVQEYTSSKGKPLYRLVYTYAVEGQQYSIMTDYGTERIPKQHSEKEIRYDPQDPTKAVIREVSRGLLYGGILFTGVPIIMILGRLAMKGKLRLKKIDLMDVFVGLFMMAVSLGICYAITGKVSVIAAFGRMGIWALIPLLMLIAAVWVLIRGIFFKGKLPNIKQDPM